MSKCHNVRNHMPWLFNLNFFSASFFSMLNMELCVVAALCLLIMIEKDDKVAETATITLKKGLKWLARRHCCYVHCLANDKCLPVKGGGCKCYRRDKRHKAGGYWIIYL